MDSIIELTVRYGRDSIPMKTNTDRKLGDIRRALAEKTGVPVDSFKLIAGGAIMKDDDQPISAYRLKKNAVISMIGGNTEAPEPARMRAPERKTQQMTIDIILTELHTVNSVLVPDVDIFLGALGTNFTSLDASTPPPPTSESLFKSKLTPDKEHTRLAELLLQSLLRLDSVVAESEWEDARAQRKTAVRQVQGVLDRLDGVWNNRQR